MKPIYTKLYNYYTDYLLKKGAPPTDIQIGKHFGFSREYVRQLRVAMEKEGYIFRLKKSRVFYGWNIERFTKDDLTKKKKDIYLD